MSPQIDPVRMQAALEKALQRAVELEEQLAAAERKTRNITEARDRAVASAHRSATEARNTAQRLAQIEAAHRKCAAQRTRDVWIERLYGYLVMSKYALRQGLVSLDVVALFDNWRNDPERLARVLENLGEASQSADGTVGYQDRRIRVPSIPRDLD